MVGVRWRWCPEPGSNKASQKWAVKFTHEGKQIVKSTGTLNKATATTRAKQIVAKTKDQGWEKIRPILPGARKNSVDEIVTLYEKYAATTGLSARTVSLNTTNLRRLDRDLEVQNVEDLNFAPIPMLFLLIPTSLRLDYFSVLEALTVQQFIAFGHKLVDINSRMPFSSFEESHEYFRQTGALDEPSPASLNLLRYEG